MPDESNSVSDIQDYFEYIIKKYETLTDNSQIRINIKTIADRITFKIKSGYYLEFLTTEMIIFNNFNSEFSYVEVSFTDQNSTSLKREDKTNITLVINRCVAYKIETVFKLTNALFNKVVIYRFFWHNWGWGLE